MSKEAMQLALEAAYLAGFNASGEGYNGGYPFSDRLYKPQDDADWVQNRDAALQEALAEQPAQLVFSDKMSIHVPDQDLYKAKPAPVQQDQHEFPLRGILASELKCWHRLTEEEADNLVAFVKRTAPQPAQRTWAGLTDGDISKEVESELTHYWNGEYIDTTGARDRLTEFARAIEAAIKDQS